MINSEQLNKLTRSEIDSLLLFIMYKLIDVEEYSTLSELTYVFDRKSLMKFLGYFGGLTLKVPTLTEFETVVDAILVYNYANIEHMDLVKAVELVSQDKGEKSKSDIKKAYVKILDVLNKYDIRLD